MNINLKTHLLGARKVIYCYVLGAILSWAGLPILTILPRAQFISQTQAVYSIFSCVVMAMLIYIYMHGFGEKDRGPVKGVKYKAKGFVCAALAFAVIVLIEYIFIAIADRNLIVTHPVLNIDSLHGYVTLILYMPFYWLYWGLFLEPGQVIPSVGYATAWIPSVYVMLWAGFGYWMGIRNNRILPESAVSWGRRLLYRKKKE